MFRIGLLTALLWLLIAGTITAQDYKVHPDAGFALACNERHHVERFLEAMGSGELSERSMVQRLRLALADDDCEMYQSGMHLEIVAEDPAYSSWVIVRRKDPDARLLWSYRAWFVPVPEESP